MKGIAVVMIEYEGHGRSDGPNVLIPCWDNLIGDAHKYFQQIATEKFPGKKVFLMGESMGGAVAYDLITHHRKDYVGAIFVAPMLKISIAPPDWVVALFYKIVGDPGTVSPLTIMPFRDPWSTRTKLLASRWSTAWQRESICGVRRESSFRSQDSLRPMSM